MNCKNCNDVLVISGDGCKKCHNVICGYCCEFGVE